MPRFSAPKSFGLLSGLLAATALSITVHAQPRPAVVDPPEPAEVAGHVAKAKQIAGDNPLLSKMARDDYWCMKPSVSSKVVVDALNGAKIHAPGQFFDNLYLLGTTFVGMFVLKTSDGLIAWDALNSDEDMRTIFEPGMKQLGLNPADIKLMIVTHGHFDHFGGAKYMQDTYKTPVALSAVDWDTMLKTPGRANGPTPPARDRVLADGEEIKIGDTTVRVVLTPGHTPGTISSIVNVKDAGQMRTMAMWGGTAFPNTSAAVEQMRQSALKLRDAARAAGAVGILNTHAFFYDMVERKAAQGNGPNPLIIGADATQRTMEIKAECLAAQVAWSKALGR